MREFTDAEIIDCLRNRQSDVVQYLFKRYLPMIRFMVYKAGGSSDDANDIFQDGLIILIDRVDRDDFELTCKLKTFLYSVCNNLWLNVVDKRKSAENFFHRKLDDSTEVDFTDELDQKVYQDLVFEIYETLDPVCQQILKLYWEGYSPTEIAKILGYTNSYVRKRKSECHAEVIRRIQNHPDYKVLERTEESFQR